MNKRPETLDGKTLYIKVGCGTIRITLNHRDDDRYNDPPLNEVFAKSQFKYTSEDDITAYCADNFIQPLARLCTWAVRRINTEEEKASFLKQLVVNEKAGCPRQNVSTCKSCADAIGRSILCAWHGHKMKNGRCWVCKIKEIK